MKIDEIVALAKAGFTAEQIAKMSQPEPAPAPAPTPAPAPAPTPAPAPAPAPAPTPTPAPAPAPTPTPAPAPAPTMDKLDEILKAIQSGNINNTNQPTWESCEDILASIINPKSK